MPVLSVARSPRSDGSTTVFDGQRVVVPSTEGSPAESQAADVRSDYLLERDIVTSMRNSRRWAGGMGAEQPPLVGDPLQRANTPV